MAGTRTSAFPRLGQPLPRYYRFIALLLRGVYFGRVRAHGAGLRRAMPARPRLVVSSHRNGAIDGYVVLSAFPEAQFLVAVQLLRHPLLRLLFAGIPVVRDKDRERYGIRPDAFGDPVEAGCAHLRAGGDLVVFPEGSSEWGWRPLPYRRGAARMACALLAEGTALEVVPVGLHYAQPDRFRSRAELLAGPPVALPPQAPGEAWRAWENRVHEAIGAALDRVSVHAASPEAFAASERHALAAAQAGGSYAEALLQAQHALDEGRVLPAPDTPRPRRVAPWDHALAACFAVLFAPVLLAGYAAGRHADACNTVTFFRLAGGFAVAWLWLPALFGLTCWQPFPMAAAWVAAALGWWRWPRPLD
jgi:hypothetical protein